MENTTLLTEKGDSRELRHIAQTVIACFFLVLIMIIALVGNIGVIMVVFLYRQMKKDISNMLLVNLSITDLTNTCLVMLSALIGLIADDWIFGTIWCDIICAVNYCLIIVSMLTLCCISLDRYQAILHPLTYQSRVKRGTLLVAIIYSWIQGAVFSLVPPVLGWVNYDYWEAICAIQWHLYRPATIIYVVSAFTLCFLGPGIILCYCYVKIIKEVKNQVEHVTMAASATSKSSKRKMSDKARIIWSLLVVVFAYFTCTAPFSVTKLIKVSVSDTSIIPGPINLSAALLGYMASAINPLIYGIFRKDFQKAYLQIIKMIFLGQRRTSTLDSMEFSTRARSTNKPNSEDEETNGYKNSMNTSNGNTNGITTTDRNTNCLTTSNGNMNGLTTNNCNTNGIITSNGKTNGITTSDGNTNGITTSNGNRNGTTTSNGNRNGVTSRNGFTNGIVHHHDTLANLSKGVNEELDNLHENIHTSESPTANTLDKTNDVTGFEEQNEETLNSDKTLVSYSNVSVGIQDYNNPPEVNTSRLISINTYHTKACSIKNGELTLDRKSLQEDDRTQLTDTDETMQIQGPNVTSCNTEFHEIPGEVDILHNKSQVNNTRKGSVQTCTIASIDNRMDGVSLGEIQTVTDLNSSDGSYRSNSSDSKTSNNFVKIVRVNIECSIIQNISDD